MAKNMKKTKLGAVATTDENYLLTCLRTLKDSGPIGFEGLVRDLLELWTNQPFRLARAGSQSGRDACSDTAFGNVVAAEMKNYEQKTSLSRRALSGELLEAVTSLDLDLWVLAATKEVGDKEVQGLLDGAERLGIDVLIVDSRTEGVGPLHVFCAKFPDTTIPFCVRNGENVIAAKLKSHLEEIRNNALYGEAEKRLKTSLSSAIFGLADARQNAARWLHQQISCEKQSKASLGQDIGLHDKSRTAPLVRSALNQHFNDWWDKREYEASHFALLGEEGTGKTWAIMSWVTSRFNETNGPIVLPITSAELPLTENFLGLLIRILMRRCGKTEKFWKNRLEGWLSRPKTEGPLFLLCLDGLNERPRFPWRELLAQAASDMWFGRIAIAITSRPEFWRNQVSTTTGDFKSVKTSGYDDGELEQVLQASDISMSQVPDELRPLIRKPRYCDLVIRHFPAMLATGDLTVERLLYEDYRDRVQKKLGQPVSDEAFHQVLGEIAQRYLAGSRSFSQIDLKAFLPNADEDGAFLQDILDGGLFVKTPYFTKPYRVEKRRLIHGLGMLLADYLAEVEDATLDELANSAEAWLEPQADMEMKASICGAAVFFSLVTSDYPVNARRALFRYWTGERNMPDEQERAFLAYLPECAEDILAIADYFWQETNDNGVAQERLAQALIKYRDDQRVKPCLLQTTMRWMGYVNIRGHHFDRNPKKDNTAETYQEICNRLGQKPNPGEVVQFYDWAFTITADDGLLRLARFAFFLISSGDCIQFVDAFLHWAVSRRLMGRWAEKEEAEWVLRLSDENLWPAFASKLQTMVESSDDTLKKAAYLLLTCLGTHEALKIRSNCLKNLYTPHTINLEHKKDPCVSIFSLRREECGPCLSREDISVSHLLWKINYFHDPALFAPQPFVLRLRDAASMLPVEKYRAKFLHTSEDHDIEGFEPALARFAPDVLGDMLRSAVRSITTRDDEGCRQMLIHLPEISLVFRDEEINILRNILADYADRAPNWPQHKEGEVFERERFAEAEGALAFVMHLLPEEIAKFILNRPEQAIDLLLLQDWFEPLPPKVVADYLDMLLTENAPTQLGRLLWILCGSKLSLSERHRKKIIEFLDSTDTRLSFASTRFTLVSADPVLINHLLQSDRSFLNSDNNWCDALGAQILCQHGIEIPFEAIIKKLSSAQISWAIHWSKRDHDIKTYGEYLNCLWSKTASKQGIDRNVFPSAEVSTFFNFGTPLRNVEQAPTDAQVTFTSRDSSWDNVSPSKAENFLQPLPEETTEQFIARQRAFQKAIEDITKHENTQWWSAQFNSEVLAAIYIVNPAMVRNWVDVIVSENSKNMGLLRRCAGYYQSLAAALVNVEPSLGWELWRRIRKTNGSIRFMDSDAGTDWMTCLPFSSKTSDYSEKARQELLDACIGDNGLLELATAACAFGQKAWVMEQAQKLALAPQLWRRAKGIIFACLADIDSKFIDDLIPTAKADMTWVENLLPKMKNLHFRNQWARHWYWQFLMAPNPDKAYSNFHLFLQCADRRCRLWMDILDNKGMSSHKFYQKKIKFRKTSDQRLKNSIEKNEKNLQDHFLTLSFRKDQLALS